RVRRTRRRARAEGVLVRTLGAAGDGGAGLLDAANPPERLQGGFGGDGGGAARRVGDLSGARRLPLRARSSPRDARPTRRGGEHPRRPLARRLRGAPLRPGVVLRHEPARGDVDRARRRRPRCRCLPPAAPVVRVERVGSSGGVPGCDRARPGAARSIGRALGGRRGAFRGRTGIEREVARAPVARAHAGGVRAAAPRPRAQPRARGRARCGRARDLRRSRRAAVREGALTTSERSAVNIQQIETDPDPYAPYLLSQAIRIGDLILVSGQVGIDDEGELVSLDDFATQADQAFRNLGRVLEAAGTSLERVAKVTIFLTDMAANFPKVVELRRKWFTPPYPADTIVEVRSLYRPEVMLEIEAIAAAG